MVSKVKYTSTVTQDIATHDGAMHVAAAEPRRNNKRTSAQADDSALEPPAFTSQPSPSPYLLSSASEHLFISKK
jgi:hypothetical protein